MKKTDHNTKRTLVIAFTGKHSKRKIAISRETLRVLKGYELPQIYGGETTTTSWTVETSPCRR